MQKLLFLILLHGMPISGFAWGHLDFVSGTWGKSTLTYALVNRSTIRYCVSSENPDKFPPYNLSLQVAQAIHTWLRGSSKYQDSKVIETDCEDGKADLVTQVGREKHFSHLSAYHLPQTKFGHFFSFIKINSEYTYTEDKQMFEVMDFAQLLPNSLSLVNTMEKISNENPMTVGEFSKKHKLHYQHVYLSTYKMLLHEMGHAFGLCDTETSPQTTCDEKYQTHTLSPAIMNQADLFYLTEDDKAGLEAILQRYEALKK